MYVVLFSDEASTRQVTNPTKLARSGLVLACRLWIVILWILCPAWADTEAARAALRGQAMGEGVRPLSLNQKMLRISQGETHSANKARGASTIAMRAEPRGP